MMKKTFLVVNDLENKNIFYHRPSYIVNTFTLFTQKANSLLISAVTFYIFLLFSFSISYNFFLFSFIFFFAFIEIIFCNTICDLCNLVSLCHFSFNKDKNVKPLTFTRNCIIEPLIKLTFTS